MVPLVRREQVVHPLAEGSAAGLVQVHDHVVLRPG